MLKRSKNRRKKRRRKQLLNNLKTDEKLADEFQREVKLPPFDVERLLSTYLSDPQLASLVRSPLAFSPGKKTNGPKGRRRELQNEDEMSSGEMKEEEEIAVLLAKYQNKDHVCAICGIRIDSKNEAQHIGG